MIGYGPEDTNFVLELTYNYTVGSYKLGNDLSSLSLTLPQKTFQAVKAVDAESQGYVTAPDGYKFFYQQGDKSEISHMIRILRQSLCQAFFFDHFCKNSREKKTPQNQ